MAGKNWFTAQQFIDAIPGTAGIISAIARKVGCQWNTAQRYINDYPTIKKAYDNECESALDMAETVILKSIKDGDTGDAKWYLSRKGKRRGFAERHELEHTGKDGDVIRVSIATDDND